MALQDVTNQLLVHYFIAAYIIMKLLISDILQSRSVLMCWQVIALLYLSVDDICSSIHIL